MLINLKIVIILGVLLVSSSLIFCASTPTVIAQSNYNIKVAKTTEADFTVTDGASYVGTYFETTYTMTGTATDFINAKDTLITSILDDLNKSSTIGYVK